MRNHGYWKIWGHAATCSECGLCKENTGDKFCQRCGAIMDGEPKCTAPDVPPLLKLVEWQCKECAHIRIIVWDAKNLKFCPMCGARVDE